MDIKKNRKKYFYIALAIGILAVFGITYTVRSIKNASDKLVNINEAKNSLEESDDMKINNDISSNYVVKEDKSKNDIEVTTKENIKKEEVESETKETVNINEKDKSISKLAFNEEIGLKWPIEGNIVKNYSMDKLVYFPTLGVFKANPAILIEGKEGLEVKSAHKGIVTKVGEDKELGKYIEVAIGNEYNLLYAQVDDIKVKNGDNVNENDVIARVAEPSSYYTKEGTHLYFKVTQNKENIDPMLLLR